MDYKNKKVLILGLGLNEGGVGSAKFFAEKGADVLVTDLKDEETLKPSLEKLKNYPNIKYHLSGHNFEDIDWAELIIKNTAIKPDNKYVLYAKEKGKKVISDVGVFLEIVNPSQIIGITGTKGKTTASSLLYFAVKETFPNTILAGNIGKSVLSALNKINDSTKVILEISSFQLEAFDDKKISPHIALITNILPDHLNVHKNMEEYINAKRIIAKHQKEDDILFLNSDDKTITSEEFLKDLKAKIIYFSSSDLPDYFKPALKGEHNLINYAAAFSVAKKLGIPDEEVLNNMNNFTGAEFRLQEIYNNGGLVIINDSASTNPDSGTSALKTYPKSILIAGGMNKGLDYEHLAESIDHYAKAVYFLEGDVTEILKSKIKKQELIKGTFSDLDEILSEIKNHLEDEEIILFSPSATSYNLFQNEFDRGRKFNDSVERIFK